MNATENPAQPEINPPVSPYCSASVSKVPSSCSAERARFSRPVSAKDARASAQMVAQEIAENAQAPKPEYHFPPINLLKTAPGGATDGTAEMRENTRRLNEALQSFKIEARICNVTRGPSVTRYEVELAQGVRLAKVTALQDDIALALFELPAA